MKQQGTTIAIVGLLLVSSAKAQENFGIINSNYAGTNGMWINPSSMVDSWVKTDIHLVGASAFAINDYLYLDKNEYSFGDLLNPTNFPTPKEKINSRNKHSYFDAAAYGPAATVVLGKRSVGIHTAVRTYLNMDNVTPEAAKFAMEGLTYSPQQMIDYSMKNTRVNSLTWAELGLSYGQIVKAEGDELITVGGTVKKLWGINAAALHIDEMDYRVSDSADFTINNFTGKYAFNEPAFNSGSGWAVDLGFTYKKMKGNVAGYKPHSPESGCEPMDYRYKIGVSLLDFGRIKFKQNAYSQTFSDADAFWEDYETNTFDGTADANSTITEEFTDDGSNLVTENTFKSKLPTAISVQFDYNLGKHFYANATVVHDARFNKQNVFGVRRANSLAITPRYERKRFEVALPISLHEYSQPGVGLAFRFNSIVIGTDRLGTFLPVTNVYAADIYVNIKYSIFRSNKCKGKGNKSGGRGLKGGGRMDPHACPSFK